MLVLFHDYLSNLFFKNDEYGSIFIIFAMTLVLFVLNSLLLAILNGQKEIKKLVSIGIVSSFVGLILTGLLSYYFGLYGALLSYTTGQAIVFFVTLIYVLRSSWFKFNLFTDTLNKRYLKKLSGYTFMAISSALSVPVSMLLIRTYIGENLGWEDAGYWDGIWKISSAYLMFVTTTLGIYYLPRLSEIKEDKELKKEILDGYKIIIPVITFIAICIYFARNIIIQVLFTSEFSPMAELFLYQMIGDVIKIASWLLGYIMIARAMTKSFIVTEIFFSISFVMLSILLINIYGLIGVTIAFTLNYLLHLFTMLFIFRNTLRKQHD